MKWLIAVIVIVGLLAVFGGYIVKIQKQLVNLDEMAQNAMSQIGVQQNSRWDALTQIAGLTREYSKHEYNALVDIIAKRQPIVRGSDAKVAQGQENLITEAMSHIMAVAEQYPELKASGLYSQTMADVKDYEENVRMSRMVYNDSITKYNRLTRQFPSNLVASMLGFKLRQYLDTPENKKDMPMLTNEANVKAPEKSQIEKDIEQAKQNNQ
ncbi:MAG: LemA family protein [Clostridia bacterium]|nr:LemA family protein [Clostridia bacterium]